MAPNFPQGSSEVPLTSHKPAYQHQISENVGPEHGSLHLAFGMEREQIFYSVTAQLPYAIYGKLGLQRTNSTDFEANGNSCAARHEFEVNR